MTATLAPVPAGLFNYDANDRLTTDAYDANGNTTNSGGLGYVYDFENRLIRKGGLTIVYDGDGNRVSKTIAGATTTYLVDDRNSTGYAQVVAEVMPTETRELCLCARCEQVALVQIAWSQMSSVATGEDE